MNNSNQTEESGVNNDDESQVSEKDKAEIESFRSQITRNRMITSLILLIMGLSVHFYFFKLPMYESVWTSVASDTHEISGSIVKSSRPFPELVHLMVKVEEHMFSMVQRMENMDKATNKMSQGVSNIDTSARRMSLSAERMSKKMDNLDRSVDGMKKQFQMPWN